MMNGEAQRLAHVCENILFPAAIRIRERKEINKIQHK